MKKTMKKTVLTLLIITAGIAAAFSIYLILSASGDRNLSGEWTAELDMAPQAAVTALAWLQNIEAVSVSLEEMESCMRGLTVKVNLTMEQSARTGGTFQCAILPESYEACSQAAYEAFAGVFSELLAERLRMAGYTGGTDGEAVEALVNETFGMSTVSYLTSYGPALLPSLEELQAQYDGSGVYRTADGILVRQFDAGAAKVKEEYYIRKNASLVLCGEADPEAVVPSGQYPVIYTLSASQ